MRIGSYMGHRSILLTLVQGLCLTKQLLTIIISNSQMFFNSIPTSLYEPRQISGSHYCLTQNIVRLTAHRSYNIQLRYDLEVINSHQILEIEY